MLSIRPACSRRCASIVTLAASLLLFAPLQAGADPLNLTTYSPGDVTSFSYDVEYNSGTGVLTANSTSDGNAYAVLDDNGYFYPANVLLTANLNPANGALESGTISIEGTEYFTGDNSPLLNGGNDAMLITGNLTAFGFPVSTDETNQPLEFEFQVTGGALTAAGQPYYHAATGGMILHMFSDSPYFTGADWPVSSFSNSGSNNQLNTSADTFPMTFAQTPEPSTFVLFAIAVLPLAWCLRRRGPYLT